MSFLKNKLSQFHHLSEESISRLVSGELSTLRKFRALSHLEKCWQCRSRREVFERVAMQVTAHRDHVVKGTPSNPERRLALFATLRQRSEEAPSQAVMVRSIFTTPKRIGISMNPVLASAVIVFAATTLMIWVWQRPSVPVSAAQLLSHAETSDLAVASGKPGVVYQKVRIQISSAVIEREIYRDALATRRRRPQVVQASSEPVRQELISAGVDWDVPLSVASYRDWHDRQGSVVDSVDKADGNLLTLVSKSTDGPIRQESLTVRASDFHPVQRTIQTLSSGTIEIAELNYAVLDWNGVNEALFEPLNAASVSAPIAALSAPGPLYVPALPTIEQLDIAELQARLELNRLHADEGEQFTLTRSEQGVEVEGIVDTAERKQEIVAGLRTLPHVKTDVLSIAELRAMPAVSSSVESVALQSTEVQDSPLEKYLKTQNNAKLGVGEASQQLLDAALKVQQSAAELDTLKNRLSVLSASPTRTSASTQLSQSYTARLLAGLDAEASMLQKLGFQPPKAIVSDASAIDVRAEINRNQARCRELIGGSREAGKSAQEIATEIYQSADRIRFLITAASSIPQ